MKLDWKLMRTILAHVEAETIEDFVKDADSMTQWKEGQLLSERASQSTPPEARVVFKHIQLLERAGYIEGVTVRESLDGHFSIALAANPSLTLDGYSLLESLRTDGFLDKLKKFADQEKMPLTIELLKILTVGLAKSQFG